MNLFYHKNKYRNFGDELNGWLWEKIFPDIKTKSINSTFIGIGTILDKRINKIKNKKIIFGTGIRSIKNLPNFDNSWDIRFVRGPLSAKAIKQYFKSIKYICDSALCVGLLKWKYITKDKFIGFIPHYYTALDYNCTLISNESGMHYIDPTQDVETVIKEIRRCKLVVTEAMHGAIIADIFRVPWLRVNMYSCKKESMEVSNFKWADWGESLQVETSPIILGDLPIKPSRKSLKYPYFLIQAIKSNYSLIKKLKKINENEYNFQLSKDAIIKSRISLIEQEISKLKTDYFN